MSDAPLFVELEVKADALIEDAQAMYDKLPVFARLWRANGVDQILAATPDNEVPLGQGRYTTARLRKLQRVFYALGEFMESPITLSSDPEGTAPGPIPLVVISERDTTPPRPPQVGHIAPGPSPK